MENRMFCYQCQETAKCSGCTVVGVCGKDARLAALQDILVYATRGLSEVNTALRKQGEAIPEEVNDYIVLNLFTTITNANFDPEIFEERIAKTLRIKEKMLTKLADKAGLHEPALWKASTQEEIEAAASKASVLATENEDIRSLRELIVYGVKGLCAYLKHAWELGKTDENIHAFLQRALAATLDDGLSAGDLVALAMETGKFGVDG
ncbi:MAG: hydroxylamine reductase, partial [Lachnospiraceae bacterium]